MYRVFYTMPKNRSFGKVRFTAWMICLVALFLWAFSGCTSEEEPTVASLPSSSESVYIKTSSSLPALPSESEKEHSSPALESDTESTFSSSFDLSDIVATTATVEAGKKNLKASDFLFEKEGHTAVFATEEPQFDTSIPGEYRVDILVDASPFTVLLTVRDSIAPKATARPITVHVGDTVSADECVFDIKDATAVVCSFKTEPDLFTVGTQTVTVFLTDQGNNRTEIDVTVTVLPKEIPVPSEYTVEAGAGFPPIESLIGKNTEGKYLSDISTYNTNLIGEYSVLLEAEGKTYTTKFIIVDTVAPTATVTPQNAYYGTDFPVAESFVSLIIDAGPVSVCYETPPEPNLNQERTPVRILLTDQSGNKTVYESYCTMLTDTEPPVFTRYPTELEADVGEPILWRASTAASDNLGTVALSLDTQNTDLTVPGKYTVYLVATDGAGNETRRAVTLILHDNAVTKEMMDAVCKRIVDSIITEGMSDEEIFHAIFRYLRFNLSYTNDGVHDDERREAYLGLTTRLSGDCFTYYAAAKMLFEYIGYETLPVRRGEQYAKESGSNHFWLMVNIGTESEPRWYHFDATPQPKKFLRDTYMMTDAQLIAYTNYRAATPTVKLYYYTYDEGSCPPSATEILVDLYLDSKFYPS